MSEQKTKQLIVFLDTIGRTIIAEKINETNEILTIQNPAVVNIIPQQAIDPNTGQPVQRMALQLFPLFFREFLAAKHEPVRFKYNKSTITMSEGDMSLDFKVGIQYEQLFNNVGEVVPSQPQPQRTQPASDQAIKLFDN